MTDAQKKEFMAKYTANMEKEALNDEQKKKEALNATSLVASAAALITVSYMM